MEEAPGGLLLLPADDVQDGAAALGEALEDVALRADRGHDQRRLEGYLRDPAHSRSPVTVLAARGEDVNAVQEHAKRLPFRLRVLVHASERSGHGSLTLSSQHATHPLRPRAFPGPVPH